MEVLHCWLLPLLCLSRATVGPPGPAKSTVAFVIIPGGPIPGSALKGSPVIIVGRLLFLRKHNRVF